MVNRIFLRNVGVLNSTLKLTCFNGASKPSAFLSIKNVNYSFQKSFLHPNGSIKQIISPRRRTNIDVQPKQQTIVQKLTTTAAEKPLQPKQQSIFKRFKDAYKQHGKIFIWCHVLTCVGWIVGFFTLSKAGFNITSLLNLMEKIYIISNDTSKKIENAIDSFNLEKFLKEHYFNYVLNESSIEWLGKSITSETLKHCITAIMLYKIFTPFRYLLTLTLTNVIIKIFKRKGVIPVHPPAGSSIRELYKESKIGIRRSVKKQREKYRQRFFRKYRLQ